MVRVSAPVRDRWRSWLPLALVIAGFGRAVAQDTLQLDLGPDTVLCPGMRMTFDTGDGFLLREWDDGSTERVRTIRGPALIHCTAIEVLEEGEVFSNGDLSAGDTQYRSDLPLGESGPNGALSLPGTRAVGTTPNAFHTWFPDCGDHSTGHGNMLIINGDTVPGSVWCGKGHVVAGTEYIISFWHMALGEAHPAALEVTVNGVDLDLHVKTLRTMCHWQLAHAFWTATSDEDVTVCIRNTTVTAPGNDFALDDMSMAPFRVHQDSVDVGMPEWCPDDGSACGCQIMIPSAFTPNSDGLNDVLLPRHDCPIREWYFRVIDHWGRTVFQTEDQLTGWDGLHQKEQSTVPAGLYSWTLETRSDAVEHPLRCQRQGYVMLMR